MNKLKNTNGFSMLSALFIIAITSFFVTIINEQRNTTSLNVSIVLLDANIANKIAELGIQLGLNELKNNLNYATEYTSAVPILDTQSTTTIFSITGGTISLSLTGSEGDLNSDQIFITSTGTYNDSTRTIILTINKIENKKMLMIEPVTSTDSQFNSRKTTFENLNWEVTTVTENSITVGGETLDPILLLSWNVIYIPQNISIDKNAFTDVDSPVATETISNEANFGILTTEVLYPDTLASTIEANIASQTYEPGTTITFSTTNIQFKMLLLNVFVSGIIHEFSPHGTITEFPAIDPSTVSIISWLPKDTLRSDSSPSPNARIILNIVPSDIYPWSLYTSAGISALDTVLDHVVCQYTNCYIYEIRNVDYQ